jgi:hypothetical protein
MADFGFAPQLTASGTIAPNRFVKISGPFQGAQCAAITDFPIGVTDQSTRAFDNTTEHAVSGDEISLQPSRLVQVVCGAAVTAGNRVGSDASGRAIVAVTTSPIFGTALTTSAAAGEVIWVYYAPTATVATA